jgi:hypothetical protein
MGSFNPKLSTAQFSQLPAQIRAYIVFAEAGALELDISPRCEQTSQ